MDADKRIEQARNMTWRDAPFFGNPRSSAAKDG
jgi:hypothetical protein